MKKYIVLALLLLPLAVPFISHALTQDEIKAQIQALMAQLQALQSQQGTTDSSSTCLNLTYSLQYRSRDSQTNGQVSDLQDFLQTQGYLNSEPTGYFGLQTFVAVKAFQKANNLEQTGATGPQTRTVINKISCSLSTTPSTTTVTPTTIVSTAPYAAVTTPTLTLSYDSSSRESKLTSYATTTITAGANPLYLPVKGIYISLGTNTNPDIGTTNSKQWNSRSLSTLSIGMNSYGGEYYIIPAGSSVTFISSRIAYPQQMFAGTYYAKVLNLYAYTDTSLTNTFTIPSSANSSAGVTIIGETSPYISSITQADNGKIVVTGVRFGVTNVVYIDGVSMSTLCKAGGDLTGTATSMTFTPSSCGLNSGSHSLQIIDSINGNSNIASFQVTNNQTATASISVVGTPTLALAYDSAQRESSLKVTATIKVTSGTTDTKISINNPFRAVLYNNGNQTGGNYDTWTITPISTVAIVGDDITSIRSYVVPAGTSATFLATETWNPQQLLAGTYYASYYYAGIANGTTLTNGTISPNASNKVTIVGETSPFITYVATKQVDMGAVLTYAGQRLANITGVYIDGTLAPITKLISTDTSVTFTLPLSVSAGYHSFQVENINGKSNNVSFQVQSTTTQPTITVISPNGGETFSPGQQVTIKYSIANFPRSINIAVQLDKGANYVTRDFKPVAQQPSYGYVPATGSFTYTLPTNLVPGTDYSFLLSPDYTTTETPVTFGYTNNFIVTSSNTLKSQPYITATQLPSSVLVSGVNTLSKIIVAADTAGQISWKKIVYNVVKNNPATTISSYMLTDESNQMVSGSFSTAANGLDGTLVTFIPTNEQYINAGSAKTYYLKATIGGSLSGNILTSVVAPSTAQITNTAANLIASNASFVWSDISSLSHSVTSMDWHNDNQVKNLPIFAQTLIGQLVAQPSLTLTFPNGGQSISKATTTLPISWTSTGLTSANEISIVARTSATGDANFDGKIDSFDQNIIASAWQTKVGDANYNPAADLNNSGTVDIFDQSILGNNWQGVNTDYPLGSVSNTGQATVNISNLPAGKYKFNVKTNAGGTIINDWSDAPMTITTATTASLDKSAQTAAILQSLIDLLKQMQNQ